MDQKIWIVMILEYADVSLADLKATSATNVRQATIDSLIVKKVIFSKALILFSENWKIFLQNLNKFCQILKFFNGSGRYVFQISNFMVRSIGWQP